LAAERDIKRRIRSVNNTRQITKAMEMVAASKLRNTQASAQSSKPYSKKLEEVLTHLVAQVKESKNPLLTSRDVKKICFYVISGDRGLAAGYNSNLLRFAKNVIDNTEVEYDIVAVGKKTREFFRRREYKLQKGIFGIQDYPKPFEAQEIANEIIEMYCSGQYDEVRIIYTDFVSTVTHVPKDFKILPIEPPETESAREVEYILEPEKSVLLDRLLPIYFINQVYQTLLQSKASEHASRMTAMHSATQNAGEMISKLNLQYNRARQAAITTEIAEIVGGANALKG
jgi:F-type H+-transporting ATPase subunit gamma